MYMISWLLLFWALLCLPCCTLADKTVKKRSIYIAIGDNDNSHFLQNELQSDWKTDRKLSPTDKSRIDTAKQVNGEIRAAFDIKYVDVRNTNLNLDKAPYLKFESYGKWQQLDKLAFLGTTFPLLTVQYMINDHYLDNYRELFTQQLKKYNEQYEINKEKEFNRVIKYYEDTNGYIVGSTFSFEPKSTSIWAFNLKEQQWIKIQDAGWADYFSSADLLKIRLEFEKSKNIDKFRTNEEYNNIIYATVDSFITKGSRGIPYILNRKEKGKIVKYTCFISQEIYIWGGAKIQELNLNTPFGTNAGVDEESLINNTFPTPPWKKACNFYCPPRQPSAGEVSKTTYKGLRKVVDIFVPF